MTVESLKYQDRANDNTLIDDVVANNERAITRLYNMYRGEFIGYFIKEYAICPDDAADIYQESFLAMHQNIVNGKLVTINSSLKTYLFKIGKHKVYNHLRDAKPTVEWSSPMDVDTEESEEERIAGEAVYEEVGAMENPCSRLLSLFYWEQKSMKEIAGMMNYKNEQVAKNRKSLCMKRLKEALTIKFREIGLK